MQCDKPKPLNVTDTQNDERTFNLFITRKPCCRKETARCRKCFFSVEVRQQHSLQV